ncbi:hypothetical protein ACFL1H_02895 [Nanoarchaeota archaeon]
MNTISRTITGIVTIIFGAILIIISFFSDYWILIYGIPILIIGFFILFNKKEDDIEQIKGDKK